MGFLRFRRRVKLNIVDKDSLEKIHSASLQILERVGVYVYSLRALRILEDCGCEVDRVSMRARINQDIVEEALRKCPREFTLYGRSPDYNIHLDGTQTYLFTNGTCTLIMDLNTGERRRAVYRDLVETAVLADALEGIHGYYPTVIPSDCPKHLHGLYELEASLNNTEKHIMLGSTSTLREAELQVKMAEAVIGDGELRRKPIISSVFCTSTPLRLDGEATDAALKFAESGVPIRVMSMPIQGVSSPVTIAGSISMANAEILSVVSIIQLAYPGAPLIYALDPIGIEPRVGRFTACNPSTLLINCASIQLAREYYNIPCGDGFTSASKIPDSQAAYEVALTALSMMASGADIVSGPGGLENYNVFSYEQFLIDYEVSTLIFDMLNGFNIDEENLALDTVLRRVGGGVFLSDKHTLKHIRSLWMPLISDLNPYETWMRDGGKNTARRARDKAREILNTHKPTPLDPDIRRRLRDIVGGMVNTG